MFSNFVFLKISDFSKKSCPRWMAAFIDDVMNFHQIKTLFLLESTENVAFIEVLPTFFCALNYLLSCFPFLVILLQVALC